MRMVEALLARDHAVYRLESICASLREKEVIISRLQHEKAELELNLAMKGCATSEVGGPALILADDKMLHEKEIKRLQEVNKELKANIESLEMSRDVQSSSGKENLYQRTIIQVQFIVVNLSVVCSLLLQPFSTATDDRGPCEISANQGILGNLQVLVVPDICSFIVFT